MRRTKRPTTLKEAITELIAVRGLARVGANEELRAAWQEIAGTRISQHTRVIGVKRGVLEIGVTNPAMLSELVSFKKHELLQQYQEKYPKYKVSDLRFKLKRSAGTADL